GVAYVHDVYTLIGPDAGTPVSFHAAAHVSIFNCGLATSYAMIQSSGSNTASYLVQYCFSSVQKDLSIPLSRLPGATFDLWMEAAATTGDAHGGGTAGSSMTLSFPDLPPGYVIVSCQGYTTGLATPARAISWGHLKSIYR